MKFKGILLAVSLISIGASSFAAEQAVKESTTPTAPEGALTAEQIQPLYTPPPPAAAQETVPQQAPVASGSIETMPTNTITSAASLPPPKKPAPKTTTTTTVVTTEQPPENAKTNETAGKENAGQ